MVNTECNIEINALLIKTYLQRLDFSGMQWITLIRPKFAGFCWVFMSHTQCIQLWALSTMKSCLILLFQSYTPLTSGPSLWTYYHRRLQWSEYIVVCWRPRQFIDITMDYFWHVRTSFPAVGVITLVGGINRRVALDLYRCSRSRLAWLIDTTPRASYSYGWGLLMWTQ